ncbi:PREDICTED: zinc finger MYM-type protein 1-like [Nicotiana attenuata]|uniref:zinc finger MYM-type protein 1-like n=1 Tax=Nicotiana attenuata TaxID=49451 RepID=UPI00090537EA|nr:PREDICTED: zinc finger MYM-type protein 1-like [Nicotiana attenuata]
MKKNTEPLCLYVLPSTSAFVENYPLLRLRRSDKMLASAVSSTPAAPTSASGGSPLPPAECTHAGAKIPSHLRPPAHLTSKSASADLTLHLRAHTYDQRSAADFEKQSDQQKTEYRIRLNASIDVARFLLNFGLSFRGHDESESSKNKGLFLGILEWLRNRLPDVDRIILKHAPKNDMMTSPKIQKDIVSACAQETVKAIIDDLNGDYFGILVDKSKDISNHEQMALALRYVDKKGQVNEPFISLVHVSDTSAKSLKEAVLSLLMKHSLSPSKIRGQGYDWACNMQGKMNGLKALILQETPLAYSVHYFAHQLQLTLVAVAKKHKEVETLFAIVTNVLNVIEVSFKRRDQLRDHQAELLEQLLESGEVESGKGLNQERGLQRPGCKPKLF